MSQLHDVLIYLLRREWPKSETERDELIARVEADRAEQDVDRPRTLTREEPLPARFDPATGERIT